MNLKRLEKLSNAAYRAACRASKANPKSTHLTFEGSRKCIDVAIELIKLLKKEAKHLDAHDKALMAYTTSFAIEELENIRDTVLPGVEKISNLVD